MAVLPSLKKRPKGSDGPPDASQTTIIRQTVLVEDPEVEVSPENIIKAFKYGRTIVPFSEEDEQAMKFAAGQKSMILLGTVPRDKIHQHYLMSTADIIVQDKEQPQPSGKMLSTIVKGLQDTNLVAIVTWVKRANANPKIFALFPHIDKEEGIYALHACQMPFSDDLRQQHLTSLDKAGKEPTPEQRGAAQKSIDKMRLDDGCGNLTLQSASIPNPAIQNFHQTIVNKAMGVHAEATTSKDILKPLYPSPKVWVKDEIDSKVFNVEWIKPEKQDMDAGGVVVESKDDLDAGQPASKRQRTSDTGASVKTEDNDDIDESLDIRLGDVAGGGDTSHGTGDAVSDFERSWREDPDKAIAEMKIRIEELVDKSTDDRPLLKAVVLLEKLRGTCDVGKTDEPEQFNKVWVELDVKYRNNTAIAFWDKVLAKGADLGRLKIDGDEDPQSLSLPAAAPAAAEAAGNDLGVDDDEFD